MVKEDFLKKHLKTFYATERNISDSKNIFSKYMLNRVYHLFKDPFAHILLKKILKKNGVTKPLNSPIDRFLLNEGGMNKTRVYKINDNLSKIKGKKILVQGCGFGKNIQYIIEFKPKKIIAFDLYEYSKEWKYLEEYARQRGVKIKFLKDDMSKISKKYPEYFDFIVSDAVLEHVKDLSLFMERSYNVLKSGGCFYASFGPLWFGPSGDHVYWGKDRIYDHLLLSEEEYLNNVKERHKQGEFDSFDLINEKLFSYKKVSEYLKIFKLNGFIKEKIFAKVSTRAIRLLKNKKLGQELDKKKVPKFDRYCPGLYVWLGK